MKKMKKIKIFKSLLINTNWILNVAIKFKDQKIFMSDNKLEVEIN